MGSSSRKRFLENHRLLAKKGFIGKAFGTTGLVLSSGYVAWNVYYSRAIKNTHNKVVVPPDIDTPQYINLVTVPSPPQEVRSMIPRQLKRSWKLMHKANCGSYEQHLVAVRELANCTNNLSDGEMVQLAQSCELHTAVGLARIDKSDSRFFLRPPPVPQRLRDKSIPSLFQSVLSSLPQQDVHECIKFFTGNALNNYVHEVDDEFIRDVDLSQEFHRNTHLIMEIPQRKRSKEVVVEYCLVALLSHSNVKSHCLTMVENTDVLPLLMKIIQEYPNNARLQSIIGKILANITLHTETHSVLFKSGWVGMLADWKSNPNLLISLPASRALSNMDQAFGQCSYPPAIYLLLPNDRFVKHQNDKSNRGVDVVLIHGLLGGVFYTWRQKDTRKDTSKAVSHSNLVSTEEYSYCWPRDWLVQEGLEDLVRVIGVDFDTHISQWGNSCPREGFKTNLTDRSAEMLQKLRQCGVGKRPVVFVGHSMGGLIIKKMLLAAQEEGDSEFVKNTRGVVFYSTPHVGTHMAKLHATTKYLLFPTTDLQDLEAHSPQLIELNDNFDQLFLRRHKNVQVISFGEARTTPLMGIDVTFVPPESSNPGYGQHYQVDCNHVNICKPDSRASILYKKVVNIIIDVLEEQIPHFVI